MQTATGEVAAAYYLFDTLEITFHQYSYILYIEDKEY